MKSTSGIVVLYCCLENARHARTSGVLTACVERAR